MEILRRDVVRMMGETPEHCRKAMEEKSGPLIGGGIGLAGFQFDPMTRRAVFWIYRPGPWDGMSGMVVVEA